MTHRGDRRRVRRPIRARPEVVRREILPVTSSGGGAPPWPVRVASGWPV